MRGTGLREGRKGEARGRAGDGAKAGFGVRMCMAGIGRKVGERGGIGRCVGWVSREGDS